MAEMTTQQKAKEAVTATKRSLSERFKIASAKTSGANTKVSEVFNEFSVPQLHFNRSLHIFFSTTAAIFTPLRPS